MNIKNLFVICTLVFSTNVYSFINKSCDEYLQARNIFNNPLYDHLNSNFTDKNITVYNLSMMNSARRYYWYGYSYATNKKSRSILSELLEISRINKSILPII